jgi:hypothetical protein
MCDSAYEEESTRSGVLPRAAVRLGCSIQLSYGRVFRCLWPAKTRLQFESAWEGRESRLDVDCGSSPSTIARHVAQLRPYRFTGVVAGLVSRRGLSEAISSSRSGASSVCRGAAKFPKLSEQRKWRTGNDANELATRVPSISLSP